MCVCVCALCDERYFSLGAIFLCHVCPDYYKWSDYSAKISIPVSHTITIQKHQNWHNTMVTLLAACSVLFWLGAQTFKSILGVFIKQKVLIILRKVAHGGHKPPIKNWSPNSNGKPRLRPRLFLGIILQGEILKIANLRPFLWYFAYGTLFL